VNGGSQLRKRLEADVKAALADRGFRRLRRTEQYINAGLAEAPLVAQLLVGLDTDRYGLVRLSGVAEVVVPAVDEAYEDAPDDALTRGQRIYRGRIQEPVAVATFGNLSDPTLRETLEWTAHDDEQADRALADFLAVVDGPVMTWLRARSTVEQVRSAIDGGSAANASADRRDGSIVRNVSLLDVLLGDRPRAVERLRRYREQPQEKNDSVEKVDAFLAWLETVVPADLAG
jgi:hypothetical protein